MVAAAHCAFATLRLSTTNPEAARLYESLGFCRQAGDEHCTHLLKLPALPGRGLPADQEHQT